MGRVYYGVTDDREQVAVKVIRADLIDRDEVRERFARETEALRTVQGAHIASLVDASEADEEQPWLAMEFVRGLTLKEFVTDRGALSVEQAAALGVLLADALRDVHAAGLLHRDLKPANVILGRDGPMVIDLGLVAFAEGPSDLTTSTATLGTPACMAPEQADGGGGAGAARSALRAVAGGDPRADARDVRGTRVRSRGRPAAPAPARRPVAGRAAGLGGRAPRRPSARRLCRDRSVLRRACS